MNPAERRTRVLAAVDEFELPLVRYARRLLTDEDLARDAVQHAFTLLCSQIDVVEGRLAAWLFRVCRNRAVDHLRAAGREQSLEGLGPADSSRAAFPDRSPADRLPGRELDPAEASDRREWKAVVRLVIIELPLPQAEALVLWSEGFRYRQIAEITGRPEGHVRVLVHRGLARLRSDPRLQPWNETCQPTAALQSEAV